MSHHDHDVGPSPDQFSQNVHDTADWLAQHQCWPRAKTRDAVERRLYKWLQRTRYFMRMPQDQRPAEWNAQREAMLDIELPEWRLERHLDEAIIDRVDQITQWIQTHQRWPRLTSSPSLENQLARWLHTMRGAAAAERTGATPSTQTRWNEARRAILDEHLPGWDRDTTHDPRPKPIDDERFFRNLRKFTRFVKVHQRMPSRFANEPTEKQLYTWLANVQHAYYGEGTMVITQTRIQALDKDLPQWRRSTDPLYAHRPS